MIVGVGDGVRHRVGRDGGAVDDDQHVPLGPGAGVRAGDVACTADTAGAARLGAGLRGPFGLGALARVGVGARAGGDHRQVQHPSPQPQAVRQHPGHEGGARHGADPSAQARPGAPVEPGHGVACNVARRWGTQVGWRASRIRPLSALPPVRGSPQVPAWSCGAVPSTIGSPSSRPGRGDRIVSPLTAAAELGPDVGMPCCKRKGLVS